MASERMVMQRRWGLSGRETLAFGIWFACVFAVLRVLRDVAGISGTNLAIVGIGGFFGSFYLVFLPLWRRVADSWKQK